jgi:hypothetical protein
MQEHVLKVSFVQIDPKLSKSFEVEFQMLKKSTATICLKTMLENSLYNFYQNE